MDGKKYYLTTIMQTHFISSKMSLNNNSSTKFKRLKYEPITIREPHKYDIKTFDDPNDLQVIIENTKTNSKGFQH